MAYAAPPSLLSRHTPVAQLRSIVFWPTMASAWAAAGASVRDMTTAPSTSSALRAHLGILQNLRACAGGRSSIMLAPQLSGPAEQVPELRTSTAHTTFEIR